jgi:hypothetical protein
VPCLFHELRVDLGLSRSSILEPDDKVDNVAPIDDFSTDRALWQIWQALGGDLKQNP